MKTGSVPNESADRASLSRLTPAVPSVHEEKCSGSLTETMLFPRKTCSERRKERAALARGTAYNPILKSSGIHWGFARIPRGKASHSRPSQPAFKSTWNGTAKAYVSMDLLHHILKWPFMFRGALDTKNKLNFMYLSFFTQQNNNNKKPNYIFPTQLLPMKQAQTKH